ncbi:hypothetical protein [Methylorubrum extorquens]|uniref:Uncharacterized protein n=1 Tax=Methylorubrum extorquens TaxID=408 RepID=A0AAX3WKF0_METEX|nr:hypothetical protein [Methylorubrum extorquens]WHQ72054.1 hypothetical protein KEC54_11190 [Methylorubrum extorquens]
MTDVFEPEFHATHILLRDGTLMAVHAPGPHLIVVSAPEDEIATETGLARYRTDRSGNGMWAFHKGMPVETVRAYCRGHGGVERAGATALALLKRLPSEPTPIPEASPVAPEVASPRPFPLRGEPMWPGGPQPRLCPGHRINLTETGLRRASPSTP